MKSLVQVRGFTLIELMTVVVVISMLCAIAVPNFMNATFRAKVARSQAEQELIVWAVESYSLDNRMYPQNAEKGKAAMKDLVLLTTPVPYMSQLPDDAFAAPGGAVKKVFIETVRHGMATYPYINFLQASGSRFALKPFGLKGTANYIVFGMGPSFKELSNPLEPEKWAIYTPSNGTISDGMITTFAP